MARQSGAVACAQENKGGVYKEPADSAADIHDSGAALDRASNSPKQQHAQPQALQPPSEAVGDAEPAQQPTAAAAVVARPSAEMLLEPSGAADAAAEDQQEEISPAQGGNFSDVSFGFPPRASAARRGWAGWAWPSARSGHIA